MCRVVCKSYPQMDGSEVYGQQEKEADSVPPRLLKKEKGMSETCRVGSSPAGEYPRGDPREKAVSQLVDMAYLRWLLHYVGKSGINVDD